MSKIFITGSADGLGMLTAKALIASGHEVVLHARNKERAKDAMDKNPNALNVVTGDLSNIEETKQVANQVNALGLFDAVIHNAGVYTASSKEIFAVNVLAPYILTGLIQRPGRLIYLSSGTHFNGRIDKLDELSEISYSDSKLYVLMICLIASRKWENVYSNAVHPGWVPTKMGGKGAPDDLQKGYETQVWLATSDEPAALVSGCYFHHKKQRDYLSVANDRNAQEKLLSVCKGFSGMVL